MNRSRRRRVVAFALLLFAAAGVALLAHAAELAGGTSTAVTPDDAAALSTSIRRAAGLDVDGRPALLVVLDPGCSACEQAREDLDRDAFGLETAGIRVASAERGRLAGAGARLPPGFFPVYLLFDTDGRIRATRRGYLPPDRVVLWVRREVLSSPSVTATP